MRSELAYERSTSNGACSFTKRTPSSCSTSTHRLTRTYNTWIQVLYTVCLLVTERYEYSTDTVQWGWLRDWGSRGVRRQYRSALSSPFRSVPTFDPLVSAAQCGIEYSNIWKRVRGASACAHEKSSAEAVAVAVALAVAQGGLRAREATADALHCTDFALVNYTRRYCRAWITLRRDLDAVMTNVEGSMQMRIQYCTVHVQYIKCVQ